MSSLGKSTVGQIGEAGILEVINGLVGTDPSPGVAVPAGDDAACVRTEMDLTVLTVDALVEGTHFRADRVGPDDLGHKSLASSLSDVAAMGARPRFALVALTMPASTTVDWVQAFYRQMLVLASDFDVRVVGGNLARSSEINVAVTVVGETDDGHFLRRSGANPTDQVFVTGTVGGASAGYTVLERSDAPREAEQRFVDVFLRPRPRLKEAWSLVRGGATAMTDVSDGLLRDVRNLVQADGLGATLREELVPLAPGLPEFAEASGLDLQSLAFGGEDYELVFTAPEDLAAVLTEAVRASTGTPVARIGHVDDTGEVRVLRSDGSLGVVSDPGYDQFPK